MAITDRLRWSVIEVNTDKVLARDVVVKEPVVVRNLSAPATVHFKISQGEADTSSAGIHWKSWGQLVVAEIEIDGARQIFCVTIVSETSIDAQTGDMTITGTGFMGYAKGIPWLANFNPIAVDPFELVQRIWAYLQSFSNANLGVQVIPASSGTQMLPGYSYDGSTLSFNFFAVFIRSVDFNDCFDYMTALARDIPFDIIEKSEWNADRTEISKTLQLGYPRGGVQQTSLSFRLGENVISATLADSMDIQPVSDIIIRGWHPGMVLSSQLSNSDPTRLRRVMMEEDANLESNERAAALAKKKLQKRSVPTQFKEIIIDPNHPNAPLGSFDVGDTILIQAKDYPWVGDISVLERILSIAYDESKGLVQLQVKADGAFNYDPINYDPDAANTDVTDLNRVANGYFDKSLAGWRSDRGQWFRVTTVVYETVYNTKSGSVRVDCDDNGDRFVSAKIPISPGEHLRLQCVVRYEDVVCNAGMPGFQLIGMTSNNGDYSVGTIFTVDQIVEPQGTSGWNVLKEEDWIAPDNCNELTLQLTVTDQVTAGTTWWTYVRVVPADSAETPV